MDGNATMQMRDFLIGFSISTTVNGVVTSSETYGIDGVGIIPCIWTIRTREQWDRARQAVAVDGTPVTTGRA